MVEPYTGRVEHAASGQGVIEIDDLDAANWVGVPTGGFVASAHAPDVWLVGVILLDGPRAWEYATADLVVTRDGDGSINVRFHGKTPFAPTLDEAELVSTQQRVEARRQFMAKMRTLIPNDEEPFFTNPQISVLQRPQRPSDEWPDHMSVRERIKPETSRLALDHDGHRVYVARGIREWELYRAHLEPMGGASASGGPLSNLAQRGVSFSFSQGTNEATVTGLVPDTAMCGRAANASRTPGPILRSLMDTSPSVGQVSRARLLRRTYES